MPPTTITILVDTRENLPLIFPPYLPVLDPSGPTLAPRTIRVPLLTRSTTLETGDYVLESSPTTLVIERKRSLQELATNLLTPTGLRRFSAELTRIATSFSRGIILLEGTPLSLSKPPPTYSGPPFHQVRDSLFQTLLRHPTLSLWLLPMETTNARRAAGEWVAAALYQASVAREEPVHEQPAESA